MTISLIEAAAAAGAFNHDIIKVARTDIPPAEAIEELRRQFPAAFRPVFDARTCSREEYEAHKDKLIRDDHRERIRRGNERDLARLQAKYGEK